MTQTVMDFSQNDEVMKLAARLRQHGVDVPPLPMSWEAKREVLRAAIRAHDVDRVICGRAPNAKTETYAERFKRLFGEALEPATKPRRKACSP